jgi:ABC-type bacteriocin/lantibiotic exporter with double-glycine peptidase domain
MTVSTPKEEALEEYVERKMEEERFKVAGRIETIITSMIEKSPVLFIFLGFIIILPSLMLFDIIALAVILPLSIYILWLMEKTEKKVQEAGKKAKEEFLQKSSENEILEKGGVR